MSEKVKLVKVKGEPKSTFNDFEATTHEAVAYREAKESKRPYVATLGADNNGHLMMMAELSALQDSNPKIDILVNAKNKIAKEDEECYLVEDVKIGRKDGVLYCN
jgi:hypothetical protein